MWSATVVEHHRLRRDLAVVRLVGDAVPFLAGQSVSVAVPQQPRIARRLSPALPPSLDGKLEFHVRGVPAGWVSSAIVADTCPGDVWGISDPRGELTVDESGREVVMLAGGTGLAPLRALILELSRRPRPPRTRLFTGARSPRDLYADDMLYLLAAELDWLTVIPVVESPADPVWPDEWYDRSRVDVGFGAEQRRHGTLADMVARHEGFPGHQVLVCGSPAMTRTTIETLVANGTPAGDIRFDPPG
nr:FAD-binding oxidoreductase [Skermania piniformis]